MAQPQLTHLLHVLDTRNTGLGRDDVAWAFDSPDSRQETNDWITELLQPETLLTREELAFYQKHGIPASDHTPTGPPLSDEDIESAIESLQASTAAIERQCSLLEVQRRALRSFKTRNVDSRGEDKPTDPRSSKLARNKAQTEFEATELADTFQARIERAIKQTEALTNSVQPVSERLLEKDDRLLDGLEKVLPKVMASSGGSVDLEEVEKLCGMLRTLLSQDVHARIDAAYKSAVQEWSTKVNGHGSRPSSQRSQPQRDGLVAELEELCREIDGLSTMAVENQYRTPITRALQAATTSEEAEKTAWTEYIHSALQHLTTRLQAAEQTTADVRAQSTALKTVASAFRAVQVVDVDHASSRLPSSSPKKSSQKGLKPLRLVQANLAESHDPATQLLRQLDVRVPENSDSAQFTGTLTSTTKEKSEKMLSQAASSNSAFADQISSSLVKADSDIQALRKAVFAYSEFGAVRLVQQDVEEGTAALETRTQEVGEVMRGLDMDGVGRVVRRWKEEMLRGKA